MKREIFYIINKALQLSKTKIIASVVSVALIGGGTAYTVINSQPAEEQKENYIECAYDNEDLTTDEPTEDKSIELAAAKKPAEDNAEAKQKGNTSSDSAIEKDISQINSSIEKAAQGSQLSNPLWVNDQATDLSEKNTHEEAIDGTGVQVNNTFLNSTSIKQEPADKKVDSKPIVSNKGKNPIASIVDTIMSAVEDKNNEVKDDFVIDSEHKHNKSEWKTVKEASCTKAGLEEIICTLCNEIINSREIPVKSHAYEISETKLPSCTANGIETYECVLCGDSFTEVVSAIDHNYIKTGNLAPTCVSDGSNIYICQNCGDSYTENISATSHNYAKVADNGHLAVYQCTGCGDSYEETYSEDHHYSQTSKLNATCTVAGSVTYQCDDCGDIYTESLPILAHKEVAEITEQPTCSNVGEIVTKCSVCGEVIKTEPIAMIEHNLEVIVTQQPTCSMEGIKTSQCKVCGVSMITETIEKAGHVYKSVVKAGTCISKEQSIYTCEVCGDSYTEETGNYGLHEYELTSKLDATCTANGEEIYSCKYCGDKQRTELEATGHNYIISDRKEATCTEKGEITYSCEKCNDSYIVESSVIAHTEGDWEVVREATESENGLKIKNCTVCGTKLQEEEIEKAVSTDQEYTIITTEGTETVTGHYDYAYAEQLIGMLNDYREENGLDRLEVDQSLVDGACIRAYEITHTFGHDRPDGTKCYTACPSASGENIARYQKTTEDVMQSWKESEGHNANMLRTSFKRVGIGVFVQKYTSKYGTVSYRYHFVQMFGY